jgi:hypothetical protein
MRLGEVYFADPIEQNSYPKCHKTGAFFGYFNPRGTTCQSTKNQTIYLPQSQRQQRFGYRKRQNDRAEQRYEN